MNTNTAFGITMIPAFVAAGSGTSGSPGFINTTTVTTFPNPFAATGTTTVAGPFNASYPATTSRVVCAVLQIYPEGPAMSQGGSGQLFYTPDLSLLTASAGAAFTQANIDNQPLTKTWNGTEPVILHWTPGNDSEQNFSITGTGYNPPNYSALGAYLKGLTSNAAFRVEYLIGYEYNPNATLATLVEKKSSCIHPDTSFWTGCVAQKHWYPLMLAPWSAYEQRLLAMEAHGFSGGVSNVALTSMGVDGNVNGRAAAMAPGIGLDNIDELPGYESDDEEEKSNIFGRIGTQDLRRAAHEIDHLRTENVFLNAAYKTVTNPAVTSAVGGVVSDFLSPNNRAEWSPMDMSFSASPLPYGSSSSGFTTGVTTGTVAAAAAYNPGAVARGIKSVIGGVGYLARILPNRYNRGTRTSRVPDYPL